jgi:hypothetical protein
MGTCLGDECLDATDSTLDLTMRGKCTTRGNLIAIHVARDQVTLDAAVVVGDD